MLYMINPAFYAQYLCLNAQAISARTGLENHYIYHSASVIQSDLDAGGIISLLFYRERTGTGMGVLSVLTSISLPGFCFM